MLQTEYSIELQKRNYSPLPLLRFASCDAITLLSIVLTSLRIALGSTNNKAGPAVSRGLLLNCERKGYCWLLKLNWLANIAANGVQSHWTLKWLGWTNQSSSNFNIYLQRCCSKQILPGLFSVIRHTSVSYSIPGKDLDVIDKDNCAGMVIELVDQKVRVGQQVEEGGSLDSRGTTTNRCCVFIFAVLLSLGCTYCELERLCRIYPFRYRHS